MEGEKRRFGDRSDGRRLRTLSPYDTVSPYIMVTRADAQNYLSDKFETVHADRYVRKMRASGLEGFGMMHVILAAYVRVISQRPRINRFISGQKIFARHRIEINMAVKPRLTADAGDTVIKVVFEPTDTPADIYRKFEAVHGRAFGDEETDFDGTARVINYIPGLVKKFTVWFLRLIDYFGFLPKGLLRVSPFHGSLFITSMGSLGIPPIFHHLYTFGNVPVFLAFGAKRYENEITSEGKVVRKKYIDYCFVTDERICDGFYFASALKLLRTYLANPFVLDTPPSEVVPDIR